MIVVKLYGGLGNQMFQYAAAKSLALDLNTDVYYDDEYFVHPEKFGSKWSFQLDLLKVDIKLWRPLIFKKLFYFYYRVIRKLNTKKFPMKSYFFEKSFEFDPKVLDMKNNTFLDGYFQSEKYFKKHRKDILAEFRPRGEINLANEEMISDLKKTNSVSLHIRRGDYVSNPTAAQTHGGCSLDYYINAIDYIEANVQNPIFYFFSDDLAWVKENLKVRSNVIYVYHNKNMDSYMDLILMSQCKHNIIANSSFSWWGAWLNQNESKIVIAPSKWFHNENIVTADIYPEDWLKF